MQMYESLIPDYKSKVGCFYRSGLANRRAGFFFFYLLKPTTAIINMLTLSWLCDFYQLFFVNKQLLVTHRGCTAVMTASHTPHRRRSFSPVAFFCSFTSVRMRCTRRQEGFVWLCCSPKLYFGICLKVSLTWPRCWLPFLFLWSST